MSEGKRGTLFLVVGPSGVGKDTLIDAARESLAQDTVVAQRTITRPRDAGGENHEPITRDTFDRAEAAGAFAVAWRAHGHAYGIRHSALQPLANGTNVIVNASRRTIEAFVAHHTNAVVLSITAQPETVRARLSARGREDAAAVAARMKRDGAFQSSVPILTIANDTTIGEAVRRFIAAVESKAHLARTAAPLDIEFGGTRLCLVHLDDPLVRARRLVGGGRVMLSHGARSAMAAVALSREFGQAMPGTIAVSRHLLTLLGASEGARLTVHAAPRPKSRNALRAKIAGETLTDSEIERLVDDLARELYAPEEISGFLVAAAQSLSAKEVAALTRARANLVTAPQWDRPIVADKHSMGGVPGSRITPVVVAVVAAHGLPVPKTSSRAITSAAGTADVMECVARVDLSRDELAAVVDRAGGAVVWSGRISHTPLDDVMNAINRPLGIRSAGLDVSSILSKKLAVGATHVLIDIPVGPSGKVRSAAEAEALCALFRSVGQSLGLAVDPMVSDGRHPIGTGVGPALEMFDVTALLTGAPHTDPALKDKALRVAGRMIAWDPAVAEGDGHRRAAELLASGAALSAFNAIADAQGRYDTPDLPGSFTLEIDAKRAGTVGAVDTFALSGLARAAGAPLDKGAGVMLKAKMGARVQAGQTLAVVCASGPAAFDAVDPDIDLYEIS